MSVEREIIGMVAEMLRYPQFHFPLAAAQRQYHDYYGPSSAALVEALYFDTMRSYLAQFCPTVEVARSPRGERGWDYRLQGLRVNHKVVRDPQDITTLWDTTKSGTSVATFDVAIVHYCSGYRPLRFELSNGVVRFGVKVLSGEPSETIEQGRGLLVLHFGAGTEATVVLTRVAERDQPVIELIGLEHAWAIVAGLLAEGRAANHIEIVTTTAQLNREDAKLVQPGTTLRVDAEHRPGIYAFPLSSHERVPSATSTGGVTFERRRVAQLMADARATGLFVPLPAWFAAYASGRPPNRYLSQRAQFDSLFSTKRVPAAAR
jgi:hypothetical protein